MKILILTRTIGLGSDNNAKQINGNKISSYGRENISDAIGIKKALGNIHDVKILSLGEDAYYQIRIEKPDVIFNLCDTGFRDDPLLEPHVAAMYDILNVFYTGNNYFTIALCQNKARAKEILSFQNILTPKFQVFASADRKLDSDLKFPMIVKPIREDGSVGIRERSVVNSEEQLKQEIDHIVNIYKQEALVEEFIDGREFTVSLMGNRRPIVLPIAEIDFSGMPTHLPKIVSYRAKWIKQSIAFKNTPIISPAKIDEKIAKMIEDVSRKCYKVFGCRGYARIDFRYNEKENKLYTLEVNPNPDLSEEFDVAKSAAAAGMSYADLLLRIIDFAMEKRYQ
ncbi:MAG TPA: ATP-grasp domain-containing protein [Candidatus Paceibacterota bacterium]|nr:ATP-grasp domain-containing protein [Candidatus Paceibacterota bacterium]